MELTNKQVELAVQAFVAKFGPADSLEGIAEQQKIAMRAAAPFLQAPWSEPTEGAIGSAAIDLFGTARDVDVLVTTDICKQFVRRRNAALAPKPVDIPRFDFNPHDGEAGMELSPEGEYVRYADIVEAVGKAPYPEFHFGFTGFNPIESAANDHMYQTVVLDRPAPPREGFKKNSADMPKDFRRQVIATELCALGVDVKIGFTAADRILAALDEVKS